LTTEVAYQLLLAQAVILLKSVGLASGHVHGTPTPFIDGVIQRGDCAADLFSERLTSS
jgi:hypothetical protein